MPDLETFVTSPHEAVRIWFGRAQQEGAAAHGVVFGVDAATLLEYRQAVGHILHSRRQGYRYARVTANGDSASYLLSNGAVLDLCVVFDLNDARRHAGRSWPIMVFHDPAGSFGPAALEYLMCLMRSHDTTHTQRIAVGSVFPRSAFDRPQKVSRDIDYAAITRSVL
jgi:hypothetical protein